MVMSTIMDDPDSGNITNKRVLDLDETQLSQRARKRARREKATKQNVRDFVPDGGKFQANADKFSTGHEEQGEADPIPPQAFPGTRAMKWNSGTKTKVRRLTERAQMGGPQFREISSTDIFTNS